MPNIVYGGAAISVEYVAQYSVTGAPPSPECDALLAACGNLVVATPAMNIITPAAVLVATPILAGQHLAPAIMASDAAKRAALPPAVSGVAAGAAGAAGTARAAAPPRAFPVGIYPSSANSDKQAQYTDNRAAMQSVLRLTLR